MTFDDEARRAAHATRTQTDSLPIPDVDELRPMPSARVRPVLVATACVVVVALIAGAFALTRSGSSKPVKTIEHPGTWEHIPFGTTGFETGSFVGAIVQHGDELVAVGGVADQETRTPLPITGSPAAWVSPNGRQWRRVPVPSGVSALEFLVATPRELYAIGNDGNEGAEVVLHSDDGRAWDVVSRAAPPSITAVTAGGPGLVAVGSVRNGGGPPRTAIWASADGRTWTRAPGDATVFPVGTVVGVAARSDELVAVGASESATRWTSLVWTSEDGLHWQLHLDALHGGLAESVAASADGFIVGGIGISPAPLPTTTTTTTQRPPRDSTLPNGARCGYSSSVMEFSRRDAYVTTWTSPDGRTWKPGATPSSPLEGTRPLFGAHGWWIAGGTIGESPTGWGAATWVSLDGVAWVPGFSEPQPPPGPCGPVSLSIGASATTTVGAVVVLEPLGSESLTGTGPDIWLWTAPK
jgi:hypothetical protein